MNVGYRAHHKVQSSKFQVNKFKVNKWKYF